MQNQKLRVLRRHGVRVTRRLVEEALLRPDRITQGFGGRQIAERGLDKDHVLRVCVYEGGRERIGSDNVSCQERAILKVRYDTKDDILMYEVSAEPIDYAEEMDSVIVHFTKAGKPVLLEILDASKFLARTIRATKRAH